MAAFDLLWRDVRFAVRGFARTPTVALTVVATLALALGLNATAFSVFNAYVFRPAAVRDADSLYLFTWLDRTNRGHLFSWREFEQFRRETGDVFTDAIASRRQVLARINNQRVFGELVTGNYFAMLGVPAALGRTLTPADTAAPGREPVIVLSDAAWRRLFASDPAIVGRQVQIRGVQVEVVGVAAKEFRGLDIVPCDFWAPVTLSAQLEDGPDLVGSEQPQMLEVTGRLRPGQTVDSAKPALLIWGRSRSPSKSGWRSRRLRSPSDWCCSPPRPTWPG